MPRGRLALRSVFIVSVTIPFLGCESIVGVCAAEPIVVLTGNTMGTTYTVKINPSSVTPTHHSLETAIAQRLDDINQLMSTYIESSEISQFNQSPADQWFPISPDTAAVVSVAQEIAKETEGAFDISVGPLVGLWNFGSGSDSSVAFAPPTRQRIESVLGQIGHAKLQCRLDPPALRKTVGQLQIDLSGIAKGFAVDEICQLLLAHNLHDFMVEIGGEVRLRGTRVDGQPWNIGIEAPDKASRQLNRVIAPRATAIATSGDYRDFHEYEGVHYSHTIDPRTGRPIAHKLAGVTVLAEDCMRADALATALLVMGSAEGKNWAEEHDVAALFVTRTSKGLASVASRRFEVLQSTTSTPQTENSFPKVLLLSFLIISIALLGMSIGVIISKRRIQGSCGGLAGFTDEQGRTVCDACQHPSPECQGMENTTSTSKVTN